MAEGSHAKAEGRDCRNVLFARVSGRSMGGDALSGFRGFCWSRS